MSDKLHKFVRNFRKETNKCEEEYKEYENCVTEFGKDKYKCRTKLHSVAFCYKFSSYSG